MGNMIVRDQISTAIFILEKPPPLILIVGPSSTMEIPQINPAAQKLIYESSTTAQPQTTPPTRNPTPNHRRRRRRFPPRHFYC